MEDSGGGGVEPGGGGGGDSNSRHLSFQDVIGSQSQTQSGSSGVLTSSDMQKFLNFDVDDSEMNDGEISEFEQFIENMSDEGYRHVYVNIAADHDPTLNVGRKDPIELQINMKSIIGEYKSCKPLKSGSLLVEVNDFNQVRKLLLVKEFMGIKVQTKIANEIGSSN